MGDKGKNGTKSLFSTYAYQDLFGVIKATEDIRNLINKIKKSSKRDFNDDEFYNFFRQCVILSGLSNKYIYSGANISKSYFHKIYDGKSKRVPERNVCIMLVFGLKLSIEDANLFIKKAGHNELYVRNIRDAIIINHICRNKTLIEVNEVLYEENLPILCGKRA